MPTFSQKKEEKENMNQEFIDIEQKEKESLETSTEAVPTEIKKKEVEIKEKERTLEKTIEQPVKTISPPLKKTSSTDKIIVPSKIEKSPRLIEIEQILSENLDDLYASLSAEQKLVFKQKGEETASQVEILLKEVKVNFKKIMIIIREWLLMLVRLIPGVNKFFLIKEVKIKTDKILFLVEKERKK